MSFKQRIFVDTATGSSPPWTSTRETASSPIKFTSLVPGVTSDDFYDYSSTTMTQEKRSLSEIIMMNKYVQ